MNRDFFYDAVVEVEEESRGGGWIGGLVGVQSMGLNSKLLRRADLRSTGPYHCRPLARRQSVCLDIKNAADH